MAEDIGNLMEARLVADETGDVRAVRDLDNRINAAQAEHAGAELEVRHSHCSKVYRYTGNTRWSSTPGRAALRWVRENV